MSGYDVVFDMMIHDIDLVLDLSGGVPEKIEASGKKVKTDQLDAASAKLLMPNGTLATIEGSRLEDKKTREITVTLEEFNLTADLLAKKLYKKLLSAPSAAHPFPTTEEIPVEDEDQLTLELKDFVRAIRHGSSPTVTGEHGLEAIRIAEAIEQGGYQA
jgi:predicted dehydrogenase